jgi:hypothetical protein
MAEGNIERSDMRVSGESHAVGDPMHARKHLERESGYPTVDQAESGRYVL